MQLTAVHFYFYSRFDLLCRYWLIQNLHFSCISMWLMFVSQSVFPFYFTRPAAIKLPKNNCFTTPESRVMQNWAWNHSLIHCLKWVILRCSKTKPYTSVSNGATSDPESWVEADPQTKWGVSANSRKMCPESSWGRVSSQIASLWRSLSPHLRGPSQMFVRSAERVLVKM